MSYINYIEIDRARAVVTLTENAIGADIYIGYPIDDTWETENYAGGVHLTDSNGNYVDSYLSLESAIADLKIELGIEV